MSEVVTRQEPQSHSQPRAALARPRKSPIAKIVSAVVVVAALAGGGYYGWKALRESAGAEPKPRDAAAGGGPSGQQDASKVKVEVVRPRKGGLGRVTEQPGAVHAFQRADLFAKVSGYLKTQSVDIGDRVKRGQVLAEIDMPELFKAVDQAKANLVDAKARVRQKEAAVRTAQAGVQASQAHLVEIKANVERYTAERTYREKELARIRALAAHNAIEKKLVDEEEDRHEAALSAEHSAKAEVLSAQAMIAEAEARVEQAEADVDQSKAMVQVAQSDLEKAEVFTGYTRIVSPYDGVVTFRGFHPGDFIRSAADGGAASLLAVARTDLMRIVVQVPDRDVPLLGRDDPTVIHVDALPGKSFEGKIARIADTEDVQNRTMRAEIDLPNPDGILREGMYGGVKIILDPPSENLTIPSSCLTEHLEGGKGVVYVVRGGKASRANVQVGRDNGVETEILKGLGPDDQVVVRYTGSLDEGVAVETSTAAVESANPAATKGEAEHAS